MTEVTETIAKSVRDGSHTGGDLGDCVARLADALRSHNNREEELLRDLILSVDAWGEARAAIMTEQHVQEHSHLDTALRGLPLTSPEIAAVGVVSLAHVIREHMRREEAAFLNEEVLRDDIIVTGQSSG
jgi:hypothetical protein